MLTRDWELKQDEGRAKKKNKKEFNYDFAWSVEER